MSNKARRVISMDSLTPHGAGVLGLVDCVHFGSSTLAGSFQKKDLQSASEETAPACRPHAAVDPRGLARTVLRTNIALRGRHTGLRTPCKHSGLRSLSVASVRLSPFVSPQ